QARREPSLRARILLSSFDNPQFEATPQQQSVEPTPTLPLPLDETGSVVGPPPVENPVWNGWDVLLIAGLTLLTLFIVEFATVIGARLLFFPHTSMADLAQRPVLALIGEFLSYIAVALYMIMLVE